MPLIPEAADRYADSGPGRDPGALGVVAGPCRDEWTVSTVTVGTPRTAGPMFGQDSRPPSGFAVTISRRSRAHRLHTGLPHARPA